MRRRPPRVGRAMKRKPLAAAAVALAGAALAVAHFDALVMAALTPRGRFDAARVPAAPSYDDVAAWSALPTRVDADDAPVATLDAVDPARAPADVFYVHPTSYVGRDWVGPVGDPSVDAATDRGATRIQASAFAGCCAVYAPRYRQANLTAFVRPSADGDRAIELAGRDVVAAFRHYLARHNRGRPFIVAAHSQGAVHAFRLLREVVAGTPLRERLVAAYLVGGPLTEEALARVPGLPVCESAAQTGCVVAWNARGPGYRGGLDFVERSVPASRPRVCVNPLTWRRDEAPGGRELNRGAVFFEASGPPPTPRARFASARCRRGTLVVELEGSVPRDLASRLLDHALGSGNHHPIEYGLFYVNLRENARERVEAFLRRRGV